MQMDLFKDRPRKAAEIVRFPVDPVPAIIRRTARELQSLDPGPEMDALWRERCRIVRVWVEAAGHHGDDMRRAVDQFAVDVHAEMQSLKWREWVKTRRPGGDAA